MSHMEQWSTNTEKKTMEEITSRNTTQLWIMRREYDMSKKHTPETATKVRYCHKAKEANCK